MSEAPLAQRRCKPCRRGDPAATPDQVAAWLPQVPGWTLSEDGRALTRLFVFESYLAGADFALALARWSDQADHHPDIDLRYKKVRVHWSTHAVGGLSENDFIGAAQASQLAGA